MMVCIYDRMRVQIGFGSGSRVDKLERKKMKAEYFLNIP